MKPVDVLAGAIRAALHNGKALTQAETENLRQLGMQVLDHDTSTGDQIRAALRWALDTAPPDARSFQTDSGIGASRAH